MRTKNAMELFANKTRINVLRYWLVYDGSMSIDNDVDQYFCQDYESCEGIGFEYEDETGYHTDFIDINDISESDYESLRVLQL